MMPETRSKSFQDQMAKDAAKEGKTSTPPHDDSLSRESSDRYRRSIEELNKATDSDLQRKSRRA